MTTERSNRESAATSSCSMRTRSTTSPTPEQSALCIGTVSRSIVVVWLPAFARPANQRYSWGADPNTPGARLAAGCSEVIMRALAALLAVTVLMTAACHHEPLMNAAAKKDVGGTIAGIVT